MKCRSRFADAEAAGLAVSLALPSIQKNLDRAGVSGRKVLHVVVLDPGAIYGSCSFDDALMYEYSIGDRGQWDADYAAFARSKAKLSWRYKMNSRRLLHLEPHRLSHDDTLLWGGVWLDGIVVAASGATPGWDEAFSLLIASYLRAIALERSAEAIAAH